MLEECLHLERTIVLCAWAEIDSPRRKLSSAVGVPNDMRLRKRITEYAKNLLKNAAYCRLRCGGVHLTAMRGDERVQEGMLR